MSLEFSVTCMSLDFSVTCMSRSVTYLHVSYVKQSTVCMSPCELCTNCINLHPVVGCRLQKGGLTPFSWHRICSFFLVLWNHFHRPMMKMIS
jgi:hypothetical protein